MTTDIYDVQWLRDKLERQRNPVCEVFVDNPDKRANRRYSTYLNTAVVEHDAFTFNPLAIPCWLKRSN